MSCHGSSLIFQHILRIFGTTNSDTAWHAKASYGGSTLGQQTQLTVYRSKQEESKLPTTTTESDQTTGPRRRAKRSLHPGVRFKSPDPAHRVYCHRGVYVDPDTGKTKYERLDDVVYPTKEARRQWAIRKSIEIRKRAVELEDGARKATGEGFEALTKLFFDNNPQLREGTLEGYQKSLRNFNRWVKEERVTPDKITRAELLSFRAWAMKLPKKQCAPGKKRGEVVELPKRRATITVNSDLRVAGTLLTWLISAERLPKLHLDDLIVALKKYEVPFEYPEFMSRKEIAHTLECAMHHDSLVYALTRNEKTRNETGGSTARYVAIAPFVAAAFLTGMRLDELCLVEWRTHVDLDHEDFDGVVVGQIKLQAENTKTKRARFVSFEVSPMLRELMLTLHRKANGKGSVFGVTYDEAQAANQRLRDGFGDDDTDDDKQFRAPAKFTYQMARSTCSTYLTNAPGIYGAAASFHSAKQLGHSQAVQEKHYAGLVKGIKPEVKSIEAAMQIEEQVQKIIDLVKARK
jgi:hypothetical protein